jgi:chromosome segregation ATPase
VSAITAIPSRGEELVERLSQAIDRFSESIPKAPFDYQALLDDYVAAVEKAADAEVRAATYLRRIDDLQDQAANLTDRLDEAHVHNRQLLTELEMARAELKSTLDSTADETARPLWKRRNGR